MVKPPKTKRIPDILNIEQLGQLFVATNILCYKVFFFTTYTMGLRLGEGINLTVGDIDSTNMRVHIRNAKGNKDRLVPLPVNTLHVLKEFWKVHHHPRFIFPSRKRGVKNADLVTMPQDRGGIQVAMGTVVTQLGIKKHHAIRFATHLLEAGVDLLELQKILGHVIVLTASRYTHLTSKKQNACEAATLWSFMQILTSSLVNLPFRHLHSQKVISYI